MTVLFQFLRVKAQTFESIKYSSKDVKKKSLMTRLLVL